MGRWNNDKPPPNDSRSFRQIVKRLLGRTGPAARVAIAIGLLALLAARMQWTGGLHADGAASSVLPGLRQLLSQCDLWWLALLLPIGWLGMALRALRWWLLMGAGRCGPYLLFVRWTLAASALALVGPGVVGEDIYRAASAGRHTRQLAFSAAVTMWERCLGLLGLAAIALCGALLRADGGITAVLLPAGLLAALVIGTPLGLRRISAFGGGGNIPPGGLWGRARKVLTQFASADLSGRVAAVAFGLSVALHLLALTSFMIACHAFGVMAPVSSCAMLLPGVWLAASLPISLGGLGVYEGGASLMLVQLSAASWTEAGAIVAAQRLFGVLVVLLGWPLALLLHWAHAAGRPGPPEESARTTAAMTCGSLVD